MSTNYGSRKFIVALVALCLVTWMRMRGALSDDATATVMVAAVIGYMGGNVGNKLATKPEVLS